MNIQNINKNDTHLQFISQQAHVIAYSNSLGSIVVHDVSLKNGECYNGSYFQNTQTKAIKDEFLKRVSNAMQYIV